MSTAKELLRITASQLSRLLPYNMLSVFAGQKLLIPLYHVVSDTEVPHIKHLYQVKTTKQFNKDLDFLLKYYEPIHYLELEKLVLSKSKIRKPCFLLTFDDGLREFYDVIAPILQQRSIPAICFLNSAFIDNKALFYRYKVSLLLNHISKYKLSIQHSVEQWLSAKVNKRVDLKRLLLSITYSEVPILDELAAYLSINFDEYLSDRKPYLTSNQIIELQGKGFCFGGHSIDHPRYCLLNFDEQIRQTQLCMEHICKHFSINYKAFAFPFSDEGVTVDFFDKIYNNHIIDISFGTAGLKKDNFMQHLQRIPMERAEMLAERIIKEQMLICTIRNMLGRNIIAR